MPGGQQRFNEAINVERGKHFIDIAESIKKIIEAIVVDETTGPVFQKTDLSSIVMGKFLKSMLTKDNDGNDYIGNSYTYIPPSEQTDYFKFPKSITLPDGRKINMLIEYSQLNEIAPWLWRLYYSEGPEEA